MNTAFPMLADDKSNNLREDVPSAPSQDFIDRLESRLAFLNQQIIKFSALAAKTSDEKLQEQYWRAARDVGREAREVREYLKSVQQRS
jgi:hypothetical protein